MHSSISKDLTQFSADVVARDLIDFWCSLDLRTGSDWASRPNGGVLHTITHILSLEQETLPSSSTQASTQKMGNVTLFINSGLEPEDVSFLRILGTLFTLCSLEVALLKRHRADIPDRYLTACKWALFGLILAFNMFGAQTPTLYRNIQRCTRVVALCLSWKLMLPSSFPGF
jgi:hypothetical protein